MDINKGSSHAIRRECFEFLKKKKGIQETDTQLYLHRALANYILFKCLLNKVESFPVSMTRGFSRLQTG